VGGREGDWGRGREREGKRKRKNEEEGREGFVGRVCRRKDMERKAA